MSTLRFIAFVRNIVSSFSSSKNGYKYSAVPTPGVEDQDHQASGRGHGEKQEVSSVSTQQRLRIAKMTLGGMVFLAVLVGIVTLSRRASSQECELSGNCTENVSRIWGQYSPAFAVPSSIDASTPTGCRITFAQVLSRHGARAPTKKKSGEYISLIDRIKSTVVDYDAGYLFIKDYHYELGADDLTPFGQQQMVDSGNAFFKRYQALAKDSDPFIRASGSERVVASAQSFAAGYYRAQGRDALVPSKAILVLPEAPNFNNTLDHGACPAFETGTASNIKDEMQTTWLNMFAPVINTRLNNKLPGANLTLKETVYLMDLCPFNTVANIDLALSDFCKLFSIDEWRSYDYYQSLDKWYGYGRGNPLGPSQGVGFSNELIARLTGNPVDDHTSTNSTLDQSPETFPLDEKLYADFSHDNTISSIYAALGLFNATQDLPPKYKQSPRQLNGFSAAWTVPFAARMYVEKMQCGGPGTEELVRVILNDRVIPLQTCHADELGRCKLGEFVESLTFAKGGGLWDKCAFDSGE